MATVEMDLTCMFGESNRVVVRAASLARDQNARFSPYCCAHASHSEFANVWTLLTEDAEGPVLEAYITCPPCANDLLVKIRTLLGLLCLKELTELKGPALDQFIYDLDPVIKGLDRQKS
uniref:Uncharacterized protein n=1 Tax=viral metagenome TaxID=1070528 RepID=A0A2V0RM36_9ZZZZ